MSEPQMMAACAKYDEGECGERDTDAACPHSVVHEYDPNNCDRARGMHHACTPVPAAPEVCICYQGRFNAECPAHGQGQAPAAPEQQSRKTARERVGKEMPAKYSAFNYPTDVLAAAIRVIEAGDAECDALREAYSGSEKRRSAAEQEAHSLRQGQENVLANLVPLRNELREANARADAAEAAAQAQHDAYERERDELRESLRVALAEVERLTMSLALQKEADYKSRKLMAKSWQHETDEGMSRYIAAESRGRELEGILAGVEARTREVKEAYLHELAKVEELKVECESKAWEIERLTEALKDARTSLKTIARAAHIIQSFHLAGFRPVALDGDLESVRGYANSRAEAVSRAIDAFVAKREGGA